MKILRLKLCYPDGDRIILNKEQDIAKYDLAKVEAIEVEAHMSLAEFTQLRCIGQEIAPATSTSSNIVYKRPAQEPKP